ncbi:hypothetical protein JMJ35_009463 [Cladonia borealis]|uniref:Nuclear RNA binding protein n=1 Tax=Cladonia borealis TaxID=184061 RepID=A0AA39V299_9LECA|nr:hypothetical protein JMJ35_009463 [Cladonia borealis]
MSRDGIQQTSQVDDVSNPLNAHPTKHWGNPRKRSHKPDPSSLFEPISNDDHLREEDHGKSLHASKRIRSSEWPLKNTVEITETDNANDLKDSTGQNERRSSTTSLRPSKFLEGSMNDKVSQRPPAIFTGDEDAMERYVRGQGVDQEQVDASYDEGIDSSKPSGMYRFGKAIASTFNPSSIWQGINGMWKDKETKTSPEKQVLQERQAKAAEAYAELKKSGYKGTQIGPVRRRSEDIPTIRSEDIGSLHQRPFRDSGIDVESYRTSTERKDSNQSSISVDTLKIPQTRASKGRSPSPFSETGSRKSSLHFRKPSLQSLKKAKSHLHLPSTREEPDRSTPVPQLGTNDTSNPILTGPRLRKEPSKKDIAKQCKLSKKVSDLENKLEIARRELELSMSTAPPVPEIPSYVGRKPFVPGALPSLPSERNMYPPGSESEDSMVPKGVQQPIELRVRGKKGVKESIPSKTEGRPSRHVSETSTSEGGSNVPALNEGGVDKRSTKIKHDLEGDAARDSTLAKTAGRARNLQDTTSGPAHPPPAVPKHRPRVPSTTPQNSPMQIIEDAPPMPAMPINVDPVKIDQAKILSMRSDRNSKSPFAALPEDIHNLWKAYPDSADGDLAEYIRRQPGFNKITDQSSILHPIRSSSLSLGRPVSTSPRRTRSKTQKRGISPPPPSLASAKKVRFDAGEPKDENRVLRKKTGGLLQAEVRKSCEEKPLPDIQKEDFDWPEDVF